MTERHDEESKIWEGAVSDISTCTKCERAMIEVMTRQMSARLKCRPKVDEVKVDEEEL